MTNRKSQVTMQMMGGKGNLKPNPSKLANAKQSNAQVGKKKKIVG